MSRRLRWLGFPGALLGFVLVAYVVLKLAPDLFAETDGPDAKGRSDARQGVRTATLGAPSRRHRFGRRALHRSHIRAQPGRPAHRSIYESHRAARP
jgi:hypothetical protein